MKEHSRRTFLAAAGASIAASVTGCVSSPSTASGPDPTTTDGDRTADATVEDADHDHHDGHHHEDVPEGPSESVTVDMITTEDGYHYSPHVVWVAEGGTVTFVNESGSHTATAYHPANDRPRRIPESAGAFDTGTLTEQGAEYEVTFDHAGVYDYFCLPHEALGMLGTVIVGRPDAHDQAGLAAPQDELPEPTHEKIRRLNDMARQALEGTGEGSDGGEEDGHHEGEEDGHDGEESGDHHDGEESEDHHDGEEDGHHDGTTTEDDDHHEG